MDKGFAIAAIALAELYSGRFTQVPADAKTSKDWYKRAAELDPQNDNDYLQAKIDFEEFALNWNEDALLGLGKIHEQGLG